ncbi:unnamed protein product [Chironomus riparius]|uniref:Uncharacterized protein n=1 Tax=Chironomus riparius TaxID=315576 RepID=A0A9N9WTL4_9DIPT|nr:unnamed protein product [Chironomus riparius]
MYDQDNLDNKKPIAFPLFKSQANTPYNWNSDNMPWKSSSANNIMMFNGIPISQCDEFPTSSRTIRKRKTDIPECCPTKQHISESKMAAFLNGLHISDDYQSHSINLAESLFDDDMETAFVNLSPQELEERLKNAQKIVLCDDVKKSLEENSRNEIYQVLADRIEKPCKALILWQPPKPLETLITDFNSYKTNNNDNKEEQEEGDVKDDDKMILE